MSIMYFSELKVSSVMWLLLILIHGCLMCLLSLCCICFGRSSWRHPGPSVLWVESLRWCLMDWTTQKPLRSIGWKGPWQRETSMHGSFTGASGMRRDTARVTWTLARSCRPSGTWGRCASLATTLQPSPSHTSWPHRGELTLQNTGWVNGQSYSYLAGQH